jgi:hypothetical protein
MKSRGLTAKYAKYAKRKAKEIDLDVRWNFFRVFRVFRGSTISFQLSQSLLTSAAALLIFVARTTSAQSPNDAPPLLPALHEIPPTVWEQHGVLIVMLGSIGVVLLGVAIWWLLQPKPPVPVPIEIQTRNELELLKAPTEDGKTISRVSQVLKHYVAVAFELPSGEMTTAEFSRAVVSSEKVGSELATSVSEFLHQCDEQKFSPHAGVQSSACSRALELVGVGERRRAELRQVAKPT